MQLCNESLLALERALLELFRVQVERLLAAFGTAVGRGTLSQRLSLLIRNPKSPDLSLPSCWVYGEQESVLGLVASKDKQGYLCPYPNPEMVYGNNATTPKRMRGFKFAKYRCPAPSRVPTATLLKCNIQTQVWAGSINLWMSEVGASRD